MRKYWGKITLSALLIFIVGYGIVSAGRHVKNTIVSGHDISIPLGSFIPFKLNDVKAGSIRSLRIRRSSARTLAGFDLRVRLTDSAALRTLQDCRLSVNDVKNIDERTSFLCLASDSGYQAFGEVTITLNDPNNDVTLVTPLLLPTQAVLDLTREGRAEAGQDLADSIAAEVQSRVRPQSRAYRDSVRAAELDQQSARYKARADSIRARTQRQAPATPVPPETPAKPL